MLLTQAAFLRVFFTLYYYDGIFLFKSCKFLMGKREKIRSCQLSAGKQFFSMDDFCFSLDKFIGDRKFKFL